MEKRSDGLALLGRALLSVLFIVSGLGKVAGFAGTASPSSSVAACFC